MVTVDITIRDYDNENYRKDIELELDGTDYLVLKDNKQHCDYGTWTRSWVKMCDKITAQYELPTDWYIYRIRY